MRATFPDVQSMNNLNNRVVHWTLWLYAEYLVGTVSSWNANNSVKLRTPIILDFVAALRSVAQIDMIPKLDFGLIDALLVALLS